MRWRHTRTKTRAVKVEVAPRRSFPARPGFHPARPLSHAQRPGGFETPGIVWATGYGAMRTGIGAMRKGGRASPPRILVGPRGAPTGLRCALKSTSFGVFALWRLSFSPFAAPSPNIQRFGGFETPGISWGWGYRTEKNGLLAHGPNEPPLNMAGPHATWRAPRDTNRAELRREILHFPPGAPLFGPIAFVPIPQPSHIARRCGGFETPRIVCGAEYRRR